VNRAIKDNDYLKIMMSSKTANVNLSDKGKNDAATTSSAEYITDINNTVDQILSSPSLCAEFRSLLARQNIQTSAGVQQMMQKFAEEKIHHLQNNASVENGIRGGCDKVDENIFSDSIRRFIKRRSIEMNPPRRSSSELAPSDIGWRSVQHQNHDHGNKSIPRQLMPSTNPPNAKPITDDGFLRDGALIPTRTQPNRVVQKARPTFANGKSKTDKKLSSSTPANLLERSYNDSLVCIIETLNTSMPKLGSSKPTEAPPSLLNQHREESLPGRRCSHKSTGSLEQLSDFLDLSHKANAFSAPCHDSFSSMLSNATAARSRNARKMNGKARSQVIVNMQGESEKIEKIRAIPTNPAFRKWRRRESSLVDNHNFLFTGKNEPCSQKPYVVDAISNDGLLRTWLTHEPKVFLYSSETSCQRQYSFPEGKKNGSQNSLDNSHKSAIHSFLGRSMKLFGISSYSLATTGRSPSDIDDFSKNDEDTLVSSQRDPSNSSIVHQVDTTLSEALGSSSTNNNLLLDWGDFGDDKSDSSSDDDSVLSLSLEDLEVN